MNDLIEQIGFDELSGIIETNILKKVLETSLGNHKIRINELSNMRLIKMNKREDGMMSRRDWQLI